MAATKPKKDVVMRPRCAVNCNCAMGGKDLRSKTRTIPHWWQKENIVVHETGTPECVCTQCVCVYVYIYIAKYVSPTLLTNMLSHT